MTTIIGAFAVRPYAKAHICAVIFANSPLRTTEKCKGRIFILIILL